MDLSVELLKLGTPGLVAALLWLMLVKSEKREEVKDARIRYLETQLVEVYDERIADAGKMSEAIHNSAMASHNAALALEALSAEIRNHRNARAV